MFHLLLLTYNMFHLLLLTYNMFHILLLTYNIFHILLLTYNMFHLLLLTKSNYIRYWVTAPPLTRGGGGGELTKKIFFVRFTLTPSHFRHNAQTYNYIHW